MIGETSSPENLTVRDLLEAGVHFGHETKRWNPKMKPFIFGARNGVYIIDVEQTEGLFKRASDFVHALAARGGTVLFVGTKRQAKEVVEEEARRCGMFYVSQRWLGGTLTNWKTLQRSIRQLRQLDQMGEQTQEYEGHTKKERLQLAKKHQRMAKMLEGIKGMEQPPDALFVVDPKKERIAVLEANRMRIPVIAICDTNCDPEPVQYVIPGNDDAIRSIKLFVSRIAEAVMNGRTMARRPEPVAAPTRPTSSEGEPGAGARLADARIPTPVTHRLVERSAASKPAGPSAAPAAGEQGDDTTGR